MYSKSGLFIYLSLKSLLMLSFDERLADLILLCQSEERVAHNSWDWRTTIPKSADLGKFKPRGLFC